MLTFDFRPGAGNVSASTTDGTLRRGTSWVRPFRHAALECGMYGGVQHTTVVVREKVHGTDLLPARLSDERAIASVIEQTRAWPGEYVLLRLAPAELGVECGRWGSAPLYLRGDVDGVRGSWDLGDLRDGAWDDDVLDDEQAVDLLAGRTRYSSRTLFRGIEMLTERARAIWTASEGLRIKFPPPADHYRPRRVRDAAAVIAGYESLLHAAVGRRRADGPPTVELSGGTDSASVALAGGTVLTRGPWFSYGMLIGGPADEQQRYRRAALTALAGTVDVAVDAMHHVPLGPSHRLSSHPLEEPFSAALNAALTAAAGRGSSRSVLTGIGGDELVALRSDERVAERDVVPWTVPAYLGRHAREVFTQAGRRAHDAPITAVPETALLACLVRAPVFLRAGWWPIAPLCDPELIRFFEWLPPEWRADKRLPRVWMRDRHQVPSDVAVPRLRENFVDVMQTGLRRHGLGQLRSMLTEGSLLFDRGYVDPDGLTRELNELDGDPFTAVNARLYDVIALDRAVTMHSSAGR